MTVRPWDDAVFCRHFSENKPSNMNKLSFGFQRAAGLQAGLFTESSSNRRKSQMTCLPRYTQFKKNFIFKSKKKHRVEDFLSLPLQSQGCNLQRIRRSTSWRQNPRLVLLVLAKCLSFSPRQGKAGDESSWVNNLWTYTPPPLLMHAKPQPNRLDSVSSPVAFIIRH